MRVILFDKDWEPLHVIDVPLWNGKGWLDGDELRFPPPRDRLTMQTPVDVGADFDAAETSIVHMCQLEYGALWHRGDKRNAVIRAIGDFTNDLVRCAYVEGDQLKLGMPVERFWETFEDRLCGVLMCRQNFGCNEYA